METLITISFKACRNPGDCHRMINSKIGTALKQYAEHERKDNHKTKEQWSYNSSAILVPHRSAL